MAEGFPGEHFDEPVLHPVEQAMLEVLRVQEQAEADIMANEAGAADMELLLGVTDDPAIEALRDAKHHVDQFDVPELDAESQAEYIVAQEENKILLAAAVKALLEEYKRKKPKMTGRHDLRAGYGEMSKLIANQPAKNIDPTTIARSKSESIEAMPNSDAARIREMIQNYRAPGDKRRDQGYDPHDPRNP